MSGIPCCPVSGCDIPVDLVFESSDGVRFGTHSINLENFSAGFPPANLAAQQEPEVVKMNDFSSEALPLFLQFMHHVDQPELSRLTSGILLQIANGAEKYCVYSARQVCRAVIKNRVKESDPGTALIYFAQNNYQSEANETAQWILQHCSKWERNSMIINSGFSPAHDRFSDAWRKYLQAYRDRALDALRVPGLVLHKGGIAECSKWRKFNNVITSHLREDPLENAKNFSDYVESEEYRLGDCKWCLKRAASWKRNYRVESDWSTIDFTGFL